MAAAGAAAVNATGAIADATDAADAGTADAANAADAATAVRQQHAVRHGTSTSASTAKRVSGHAWAKFPASKCGADARPCNRSEMTYPSNPLHTTIAHGTYEELRVLAHQFGRKSCSPRGACRGHCGFCA